ncbi:hypothetical protein GCM10023315_06910 [Algibacter aquimarinus]|uniref:Uncharacterized protein n=2 Tax=Algibacter aquimarinus TaxID=1136748 RepID=A0ABP9H3M4_9FLAO
MKKIEYKFKTINMKSILIIIGITCCNFCFTQNTYLKITENNKTSISYPPETKFVLKNKEGYYILKESNTPLVFKIDEPYTLDVFPDYKKEKDVYNLTNGKIELIYNPSYDSNYIENRVKHESNGISLVKTTFTNSTLNEEESNVIIEFSNGVIFSYTDEKVVAKLNGVSLHINGKYLIYSDSGIIKLSYNPKSKQIWWVFEPK